MLEEKFTKNFFKNMKTLQLSRSEIKNISSTCNCTVIRKKFREFHHGIQMEFFTPHVGTNYIDSRHKRLLLVGESHYTKDCTICSLLGNWYRTDTLTMVNDSSKCDTSWLKTDSVLYDQQNLAKFFVNIKTSLKNVLKNLNVPDDKVFDHIAFLNYFLRPARNCDKYFTPTLEDRFFSLFRLVYCIEQLKPELVIFLSSKVYRTEWDSATKTCKSTMSIDDYVFQNQNLSKDDFSRVIKHYFKGDVLKVIYPGIEFEYTYHPSRCWEAYPFENEQTEHWCDKTSKEHFEDFLRKNWLK